MQKFGHLPTERLPLQMLVNKIVTDLFLVFAGNGYKNVAFQLVVSDLDNTDALYTSGNLRAHGVKSLLELVLEKIEQDEKVAAPNESITQPPEKLQ